MCEDGYAKGREPHKHTNTQTHTSTSTCTCTHKHTLYREGLHHADLDLSGIVKDKQHNSTEIGEDCHAVEGGVCLHLHRVQAAASFLLASKRRIARVCRTGR